MQYDYIIYSIQYRTVNYTAAKRGTRKDLRTREKHTSAQAAGANPQEAYLADH